MDNLPSEILINIFEFSQDIVKWMLVSSTFKRIVTTESIFATKLIHWPKYAEFDSCVGLLLKSNKIYLPLIAERLGILSKDSQNFDFGVIMDILCYLSKAKKQLFIIVFVRSMLKNDNQILKNLEIMESLLTFIDKDASIKKVLLDNFIFYGKVVLGLKLFGNSFSVEGFENLSPIIKEELICNNIFEYDQYFAKINCMKQHNHPKEIPFFVIHDEYSVTKNGKKIHLHQHHTKILIIGALIRKDYKLLKRLIPKCFNCPGSLLRIYPCTNDFFDLIFNIQREHTVITIMELCLLNYARHEKVSHFVYFMEKIKDNPYWIGTVQGILEDYQSEFPLLYLEFKKIVTPLAHPTIPSYLGVLNDIRHNSIFFKTLHYLEINIDSDAISNIIDYDMSQDVLIECFFNKCIQLRKYSTIFDSIGKNKILTPERYLVLSFIQNFRDVDFVFVKMLLNRYKIKKSTMKQLEHFPTFSIWWNLFKNKVFVY